MNPAAGLTFAGDSSASGVNDYACVPSIYGVSAAVDWSPYYEGEIGYVGPAFEGSGSYGASQGAFEVQGDRHDGGRAVEVILELYLVAASPTG